MGKGVLFKNMKIICNSNKLLAQSQQWKHQNVWHLFKIIKKKKQQHDDTSEIVLVSLLSILNWFHPLICWFIVEFKSKWWLGSHQSIKTWIQKSPLRPFSIQLGFSRGMIFLGWKFCEEKLINFHFPRGQKRKQILK